VAYSIYIHLINKLLKNDAFGVIGVIGVIGAIGDIIIASWCEWWAR
jgi:hypothetical protein